MRLSKVLMRSEPPLALSVSVDDVLDAFYDDFATLDSGRYWWWIQMLLLEPNEIIVNNGDNDLYRMAFTIVDNGLGNDPTITFNDAVPVRLEPIDTTISDEDDATAVAVKSEAVAAACAGIASVRGKKVMATYKSREESRPRAKKEDEQVREHLKKLRAKLGLGDDVPDEKVLELAAERLDASEPGEATPGKVEHEGEEPKTPAPKKENEPEPTTPSPEKVEPGANETTELKAVTISAEALADLQSGAAEGREARRLQIEREDSEVVQAAVAAGKIPPRAVKNYLAQMKQNREGTIEFLAELDENVIPVTMRGASEKTQGEGAPVDGAHPDLAAYMSVQFPEVVERKQRLLSSSGSRVHTDA